MVEGLEGQVPEQVNGEAKAKIRGPGLSGDNYGGVVALLDEFATAAGAAAAGRTQQSRRSSASATL
jgi:brefeldin A-resistance guanine nucleotide exchange factor 1